MKPRTSECGPHGVARRSLPCFLYPLTVLSAFAVATPALAQLQPLVIDDSFVTSEDSVGNTLTVLANDFDPNGGSLTITAVSAPDQGGAVTISAGSTLIYSPAMNFAGEETFTYTVETDAGTSGVGTVTVTVAPVNDAPIALDDSFTVAEDSDDTDLDVLANDTDPEDGDDLTIVSVAAPAGGTVSIESGGSELEYEPNENFNGTDTFTYTVADDEGAQATATVTVTVTPVNDDPTAADDTASVAEHSVDNAIDVLANDTDADGDTLTVTAVGPPNNGGTVAIAAGGASLSYTPAPGFTGEERFSYTIEDAGGETDEADVTITVTNENDAPTASDDSFTVDEDSQSNALDVLANDTDPDEDDTLTITGTGAPAGGTIAVGGGGSVLTYTPFANFNGTDTFTYTVADEAGATATAAVTVTVTAANDAPVANDDSFSVDEDSTGNRLDVLANDSDPDGNDTFRITAAGEASQGGTAAIEPGGTALIYTPAPEFSGSETLSYTITDDAGDSAQASVTIGVASTDDAPTIEPDPIPDQTAEENQPFALDLAQFVTDADTPSASLTYALAGGSDSLPEGLSLGPDGAISGTPATIGSVGAYTIAFTVSDGSGTTTSQPFQLTVLSAGRVDLGVGISAAPNPAGTDETVTWTFAVTNHAPDVGVPGVRLDITVGGQVPFAFDDPAASGCTIADTGNETQIGCVLTQFLAGGQTTTVELTGRGVQPGDVVATATVAVDGTEPIDEMEDNDSASVTLSIAQSIATDVAQRIGGIDARSAAAGDVNGDGFDELVVATGGAESMLLFLNTVDPNDANKRALSSTATSLGAPGADNDVALVDLDADGDLDIASAGAAGRSSVVLINDGDGGFSGLALGDEGADSRAVAAGDVDGDGRADLVLGNAGAIEVRRGTSAGFSAATLVSAGDTRDVVLVDVLGDALPELVVASADGDAALFRNTGGTFALERTLATGPTTSVAAGDFNGDGFADLAFGKAVPPPANPVFLNTSAGSFFRSADLGAAPTLGVTSADMDLDGDGDLVFVNESGAHQIFLNSGNSSGEFVLHARQIAEAGGRAAAAGSFSADGRVDLALVGAGGIAVLYNDGSGNLGLGDTEPPVLELIGEPSVLVEIGSSYTDAGATANDDVDGNVDDRIIIDNPLDTAVIGTYTITYGVTDLSGNAAAPVTRTVQVQAREGSDGGGGGGAAGVLMLAFLAACRIADWLMKARASRQVNTQPEHARPVNAQPEHAQPVNAQPVSPRPELARPTAAS